MWWATGQLMYLIIRSIWNNLLEEKNFFTEAVARWALWYYSETRKLTKDVFCLKVFRVHTMCSHFIFCSFWFVLYAMNWMVPMFVYTVFRRRQCDQYDLWYVLFAFSQLFFSSFHLPYSLNILLKIRELMTNFYTKIFSSFFCLPNRSACHRC